MGEEVQLTVVAALFARTFGRLLGKHRACVFMMAGIVLYVLLVGADAVVVRAGVMGGLYATAPSPDRRSLDAVVMTPPTPTTSPAWWRFWTATAHLAASPPRWAGPCPATDRRAHCANRAPVLYWPRARGWDWPSPGPGLAGRCGSPRVRPHPGRRADRECRPCRS